MVFLSIIYKGGTLVKSVVFIILFFCSAFSMAQSSLELSGGLNFNPLLKFVEYRPYMEQPYLFHIGLRTNILKDKSKLRIGINFGRSRGLLPNQIIYSKLLNVGLETPLIRIKKFQIYGALDIISYHKAFTNTSYSETAIGAGPVIGFKQFLTNKLSIASEINLDLIYIERPFEKGVFITSHRFIGVHINYILN
jgi:hypothetical protein